MTRTRPGLLFTLVGPAGAGKNSLMRHVIAHTSLKQIPTATTRAIRPGEQEGREHLYVSLQEFQHMIDRGDLLEHQLIHGNFYGIPRKTVEEAFDSGRSIIADIEVLGAAKARAAYPENVITIFIQAPSIGTLIERMRDRNETAAEISKRLLRVPMELEYAPACNYVILNDSLEHAANKLYDIVTAEMRGERSTAGDPLISYRLNYLARAVPVYDGEALCRADDLGAPFLGEQQQPHEVALGCLRDTLGFEPSTAALITGGVPEGAFLPPLTLDCVETSDGERITYTYAYELDEHIAPPAGWSWQPIPEPLRKALEGSSKRESA